MSMTKDPVCGMQVNSETARYESEYQGQTHIFCSEDCKRKFDQSPEQYASRR